ncbi:hypothetical protein G6F50_016894 [Rhizopus delemar]|uniref:HTH gntR-type domain-containing protein n=1 Tax=Rhizopus delemar TaxID=936053 RepID=A0A9P6XS60_9FUNG|nr:hypothetical protein G6F50_016894 [Rhizopus delemar]
MIDRRPKDGLPPLVPNSADPLYRQVYERFRSAITQGTLAPGDRIPSARALAKEMGVARGTIEVAHDRHPGSSAPGTARRCGASARNPRRRTWLASSVRHPAVPDGRAGAGRVSPHAVGPAGRPAIA